MLQIKNICKEYRTGSLVQKALDNVSLNLRDNEFVAILGPSGSGKTTLLNVIGGLDRYDSGDLIINGISTKRYKDRDWDSYRNHTIGFVFQSYNLIPHQTVLANVELALTIGGISKSERRARAVEALEEVGLGDQIHKKPSQMSGGQMQRVAIARALVNDPDILLADEPTGALDSDTSVQVMELLKEVASDRLVVMVTHNPELAETYATRIVNLKDGVITHDTDPFIINEPKGSPIHKNLGKASMSFLTALALSFNNLRTKLARTLLVAIAGSIGIIGIALILSISTGVNQYINDMEEDTLSEYPLEIGNASFDLSSFIGTSMENNESDADVVEWKTVTNMMTKVSSNDLKSLKEYIESGKSNIYDYSRAIEYRYSPVPQIYLYDNKTCTQVNPDTTFDQMGMSALTSSMFSSSYNTNSFFMLPSEKSLYIDQYDVMAGRWPENEHELVVVVSEDGLIGDLTLYALGLKDKKDLDKMIQKYNSGEVVEDDEEPSEYSFEDFIGLKFKLIHSCDLYTYDKKYKVWTNKSGDEDYVLDLVKDGEDLEVVGIVMPNDSSSAAMLSAGIAYIPELKESIINYASESKIVKQQLADPDTNVITGQPFGEEEKTEFDIKDIFKVDEDAFADAFNFDPSALDIDFSSISFDPSGLDLSGLDLGSFEGAAFPEDAFEDLLSKIDFNFENIDLQSLFTELLTDFLEYSAKDPSTDYAHLSDAFREYLTSDTARNIISDQVTEMIQESGIEEEITQVMPDVIQKIVDGYIAYAEEKEETGFDLIEEYLQSGEVQSIISEQAAAIQEKLNDMSLSSEQLTSITEALVDGYNEYAGDNDLPDISKMEETFSSWLSSSSAQKKIRSTIEENIDTSDIEKYAEELIEKYSGEMSDSISQAVSQVVESAVGQLAGSIQDALSNSMSSMTDAFEIDTSAFTDAFSMEMTEEELQELMTVLLSETVSTLDTNLNSMGYQDFNKPSSIVIYPRDFDAKQKIKDILDNYNQEMTDSGQEDKVITYTDIVGTLMSSVTKIINAVSYVLIAFVAISLIVSSIMIGVITYISVLERKKEIGILRAIGASKHNISAVFNAETVIIGLLAGLLGVGISELLLIPINLIVPMIADINNFIAFLPASAAVILVLLSMALTLIGGLIPSRKAAKSDPVAALRSD